MKTKLYAVLFTLMLFSVVAAQDQKQQQQQLPDGVSADWFSRASDAIAVYEYSFHPSAQAGQYRVANAANHVGFVIDENGYNAHSIRVKADQPVWNAGFKLAGITKGAGQLSAPAGFTVLNGTGTIVYQSNAYSIEYINDKKGLRQNFIINQKPAGDQPLRLDIQLQSQLTSSLKGNTLSFHTPGDPKDVQLYYEDLKVWDANGQSLTASMQLDASGKMLSIVVDDKNAVYPVTVDPLNHTPEWITSADGILPGLLTNLQLQVQTLYGYTVAGLGDVNGDNFDDVAVSAPTMADVVSGTGSLTGVGAVFIYFGSNTGLPTTPSRVFQPTTAVTGALFGFSVTGGDVTGDGINDVIIGAPLDRADVDLGGGSTVNATVGKIYLYQGGALTGTNPTPLLSLSLSTPLLNSTTAAINPLFGFDIAVASDVNGDNKGEIVVGAPTYARLNGISAVKTGGAFVFLSNASNTFTTVRSLAPPTGALLGLLDEVEAIVRPVLGNLVWNTILNPLLSPVLDGQLEGLLFGYSVDGMGDYNNDGTRDVVVGAPAGVNLNLTGLSALLNGVLTGQILGGSAYVFNGAAINTTSAPAAAARLQAQATGLLSNAANLFGYEVRGITAINGVRNGNVVIGAPAGAVLSNVIGGLQVKAGQMFVFRRKTGAFTSPVTSDQVIASPRSSSILSILAGQTINLSVLYASSIDNMLDVNCDGFGDLIVGEPLSSAVPLIGANVVGGAAYVYLGTATGLYQPAPHWSLTTSVSPLLGVNATALVGYSVAGAKYVNGRSQAVRALVGGPSNTLDFGSGLLNLGNTLGTTFSFVFDNNGLGKAYTFPFLPCGLNIPLPATLMEFRGQKKDKTVQLTWTTSNEDNVNYYELQRSTDGTNFQAIAMVFGKGEPRNDYGYTDTRPFFGTNYYRLKIVDRDGRFAYSAIVTARFDEKLPGDVVVAPNPVVANDIRVKLIGLDAGNYRLELMNTAGQLIQGKTVKVSQYDQTETMMRSANMPAGVYWLNVYNDTHDRVKTVRVFMNNE